MQLQSRTVHGREYLELVTTLLQRARLAEPTGGVWEAGDFQWAWRRDQHPDPERQVFWFDDEGAPVAAFVVTNWGDHDAFDVVCTPPSGAARAEVAWARAAAYLARTAGPIETTIRDDDALGRDAAHAAGLTPGADAWVSLAMPASNRPAVSPLADGFRLRARAEVATTPHHMIGRNGAHVAERLLECSIYRPELDLFVEAPNGDVAAYGLFWADPVTKVGLVEPMRTEDEYQRLGLARHVLTAGLERLAAAGSTRLQVTYAEGNDASRTLYLGAGFTPWCVSRSYVRRT